MCKLRCTLGSAVHLAADVDCVTAPGQLECHKLAEAGGGQLLVQHGLGEALVLADMLSLQ